jgi:aryl-alcohol dehydrogenase-like predicted oxidoreductase
MNTIGQDFENHANRIAAGFRAMSPEPQRQHFNPNHNMTETTAPETATETAESSTQQTIRESGLVGGFELTWTPPADIEALTTDLLGKNERAELLDLNAACIRLADEVSKAANIPVNPAKVALAWHAEHPGEAVPQDLIEAAANGEQLRRCAKTTAKIVAGVFFDENCTPAIKAVFSKGA